MKGLGFKWQQGQQHLHVLPQRVGGTHPSHGRHGGCGVGVEQEHQHIDLWHCIGWIQGMDRQQSMDNEDIRLYVLLFPFILAGTEALFFAVIACIFGAKWQHSSISREPKMPRITNNHLHCHSWVLPQNFICSTSCPIQLLLQHQVLHIQHSPCSCQESIQCWDPAHTHHIVTFLIETSRCCTQIPPSISHECGEDKDLNKLKYTGHGSNDTPLVVAHITTITTFLTT